MSRTSNDPLSVADFFSHHALEMSIELIENYHPGLADAIKKALSQMNPAHYDFLHNSQQGDMYFNAQLLDLLHAHTIGKIVSALTEIGEHALQNQNLHTESAIILRKLIDDWVQLTEWILNNSTDTKTAFH